MAASSNDKKITFRGIQWTHQMCATTQRNLMGGKLSSSSREWKNTCFYVHHHFRCKKSVIVKKRCRSFFFAAVDMRNELKEHKKWNNFFYLMHSSGSSRGNEAMNDKNGSFTHLKFVLPYTLHRQFAEWWGRRRQENNFYSLIYSSCFFLCI